MKTKLRQQRQDSAHKPVEKPTPPPAKYTRPDLVEFVDELLTTYPKEQSASATPTPNTPDPDLIEKIRSRGAEREERVYQETRSKSWKQSDDTFTRRYKRHIAEQERLRLLAEAPPELEPEPKPEPAPKKSSFWNAVRSFFWGS